MKIDKINGKETVDKLLNAGIKETNLFMSNSVTIVIPEIKVMITINHVALNLFLIVITRNNCIVITKTEGSYEKALKNAIYYEKMLRENNVPIEPKNELKKEDVSSFAL